MSKRSKGWWFEEDPMMEAVTWAALILLGIGFFFGFWVGFGTAYFVR